MSNENTITEQSNTCPVLSDEPSVKDYLGCDKYFKGLSEFIRECPTPMTIAIQGGWGTGKSSAMEIIKTLLKERKTESEGKIIIIDFNTWQYAKTANKSLFVPLLCALNNKVDEEGKNNCKDYEKKNEENNNLIHIAMGIGAMFTGALEKAAEESVIGKIAKTVVGKMQDNANAKGKIPEEETGLSDYFEGMNRLKKALQEKVNFITNPANSNVTAVTEESRIVVFVDDLDRLSPEVAVELLEDMKNIMSFKGCVFVLALDHEIVKRGLREKYGKDIEDSYAERFFDKIIQMPFTLPVNKYNINNYLKELQVPVEESKRLSETDLNEIVAILEAYGDTNPRTIKRALNVLRLYLNVEAESKTYEGKIPQLFSIILLQMNHKALYDKLVEALKADYRDIRLNQVIRLFEGIQGDYTKTSTLLETLDMENWIILEKLNEVFGGEEGRDYDKLYEMILDTALTDTRRDGIDFQVKEMKDLLRLYIEREICKAGEDGYVVKDVGIVISTTKSNDHVNLNIKNVSDLDHVTEEERKQYFEDKMNEEEKAFEVRTQYANITDNTKMDILYTSSRNCCLRNITLNQPEALLFVGRVLRNIRDYGRVFPE